MNSPADAASSNSTPPRLLHHTTAFGQQARDAYAQDAASPADKGVCIINTAVEHTIDAAQLAQNGYKVRNSTTCLPDLLVTGGKGSTIAVMALDSSLPIEELQKPGGALERIDRMHSKGFPCAFVIVLRYDFKRTDLLADMLIDAACKYQGKPAFVHAAPASTFAEAAMSICTSVRSEECQPLTIEEKAELLTSSDAQVKTLMNIPGLNLAEDEAFELSNLGSLQNIADSTVQDITGSTNIPCSRAEDIVTFFLTANH